MLRLIPLAVTIYAFYLMISKKKGIVEVSQDALTKNEKIIIWIICFFTPVWGGAIFYYGWKKLFPIKAKAANQISLWMFLIQILLGFALIFLVGSQG